MGVTWPVSSKRRLGTADRVGEVYRGRWSRRAGSEKRAQVLRRATGNRTDLDADLSYVSHRFTTDGSSVRGPRDRTVRAIGDKWRSRPSDAG